MSKYYSAETGGFYDTNVHGKAIPAGAVEISDSEWVGLLDAQGEGKEIAPLSDGRPYARVPVPTAEGMRLRRNTALASTDAVVARHRDEVEMGAATTLTGEQFKALLRWRQALRDITKNENFPHVVLPERPDI